MQNCAFGLNNLVKTASLTGSNSFYAGVSAAKDFSPNQLATDQGNTTAAFWSVGDGNTTAWFQAQWGSNQTMRAFFVGRTNLGQSATWQLTASAGGNTVYSASGSFATLGGVGPVQMVHVAPQDIQADTVKVTISSNDSVSESYISLSLAYIGPVWQPVRNMSTKSTTGLDSSVTVNTGMSGAEFVTPAWMRRKAVVDHESLDLADVPVLEQILILGASGANVLFVPDPDADGPTLNLRSLFGRIQRGDLSNPYGAALRQQTSFTITERL